MRSSSDKPVTVRQPNTVYGYLHYRRKLQNTERRDLACQFKTLNRVYMQERQRAMNNGGEMPSIDKDVTRGQKQSIASSQHPC